MSSSPTEPRPLLDALRAGTPLPAFPAEAVERARALALGVATAASSDVEALPEPLATAVLEAAVLAGQPALPEALSASSVKALAKAAKKALYRLRSRGVAVPESPHSTPPAESPRAPAPAPEALPGLVTPFAPNGERGLVLGRLVRGGVEMTQAIVMDEQGVVELSEGETSRASYRRLLKESTHRRQAVEVPHADVAALLAEAAGTNLRTRTPFPPGLDAALRHHGVQPVAEPAAPPPPEPDDVRRVLEGYQLHSTPELAAWLPPEPEVRRLMQKVDEVLLSPLALSEHQRQEQLTQAIGTVTREFFTPEVRRRYGLRLWRMADFFERTGRAHEADLARGEARRLYHGPEEPYSRFAETLFQKVLALAAAANSQGPEARGAAASAPPASPPGSSQTSGTATPAPPTERRSPGGLILP